MSWFWQSLPPLTLVCSCTALRSLATCHSSTSWVPLSASRASAFTPSCWLSWPGDVFWPDTRRSSTPSASSPPCFRSASPSAVSFCKQCFPSLCRSSADVLLYNTFEPLFVLVCCFVCKVGPAGSPRGRGGKKWLFSQPVLLPSSTRKLTVWVFYRVYFWQMLLYTPQADTHVRVDVQQSTIVLQDHKSRIKLFFTLN